MFRFFFCFPVHCEFILLDVFLLVFLSAVGKCGCQGDRQETGRPKGNSASEAHGNEGLFHSDSHPSQLPSVAWQLWNVMCLSAWVNSAYVYISVWGGWYVCLYSICTNVYRIQQLESLYPWVMSGRANLNSGDLSRLAALHSAHRFWLVEGQDATNSLPGRAHCIITAVMPSWAERREPDQSVSLR